MLDKGKIEEKEWEDKTKLSKLINDCINIEDTINNINIIYDKIKAFNDNKEIKAEFNPKYNEIEKGLKEIKNFGNVNILKNKNEEIKELNSDNESNGNELKNENEEMRGFGF